MSAHTPDPTPADGPDPPEAMVRVQTQYGTQYIEHHYGDDVDYINVEALERVAEGDSLEDAANHAYTNRPQTYPDDEELLDWIRAFTEEFGVVPSSADVRGWPGPSEQTYRRRWGTFTKAIRAAGLTPRSEG